MTRHPTARRVHREAAPDDTFIAGVLETSAWARRHGRALIIGGIAAAILILGLIFFFTSRQSRNAQAAVQLSQVRAVAFSGNNALAVRELEQFVGRYGGTTSGDEARLLLAKALIDAGEPQRAQQTVQPMARNLNRAFGMNAALLLAAAYEAGQEPNRAEEVYLRIGSDGRFLFERQDGLDNAARIRLQRGDAAGAAELYQRILDITPTANVERPVYELRLGEALAGAVTGGPTNAAPPPTTPAGAAPAGPPEGSAVPSDAGQPTVPGN